MHLAHYRTIHTATEHLLRHRNRWIDNASLLAFALTAGAVWLAAELHHLPANFWGASALLCLPFAVMLTTAGFVTLASGPQRFVEFWQFHQLKHGVRIRLLGYFYVPLAALGLISATKIWL